MTNHRTARRLLGVHFGFVLLGGLLLAVEELAIRHALWITVLAYNLFLPVFFERSGEPEVVDLWSFLLPLSLLQILPDWYLTVVQETLVFPTAHPVFPVPLFMGGLWTPPLVMTTAAALWVEWRWGARLGYAAALTAGLVIFAGGEWALTSFGVWRAVDVATIGGVAYYILPAELSLVVATLYAYRTVRDESMWQRLVAAPAVTVFYLGAATTSYLLIQVAG